MIDIRILIPDDLIKICKLRQKIAAIETEIGEILAEAERRPPPLSMQVRSLHLPRSVQPSLRDLISAVLQAAGKPLSVTEIYEASLKTGYQWRSGEPINALNVKMYTDDTFKKAAPGRFVLRAPGRAAKTPKSRSKA
jgi:hypothetical protein